MEEVNKKEGYRSILEMGPLLMFFGVNYFYGIMAGTAVLVVSTLLSLILSCYWVIYINSVSQLFKSSYQGAGKHLGEPASPHVNHLSQTTIPYTQCLPTYNI